MTCNDHIDVISIKIIRSILILIDKHYLPVIQCTIKTFYRPNNVKLSHLTYVILAWGSSNILSYKLQKKITQNYC